MKKTYIVSGLLALSFAACKPKLDTDTPQKGDADFSTYVSVGNSLTAGYANGSLYKSGQQNSYPSMLATQFKMVGGGDFKQPLLPGEAGWPDLKKILVATGNPASPVAPVDYNGPLDTAGSGVNISSQGPFNNVGVPGIRCIDYLYPGYGMLNPYATRFFSSPATEKPLDEALKIKATFFSMWLGANDVLGYATSGGEGANGGPNPTDISPLSAFTQSYNATVQAMTAGGAKGVLMNIPDVTSIPYFTTIPINALVLQRQGQVDSLNAAYAPAHITFHLGANNFIIQDPSVPVLGFRQAQDGELLILTTPQDSLAAGWGSRKPIPKQYVLDATEISNVQTATNAFNQVIQQAATTYKLAYVDMNSYLKTIGSGVVYNGVSFNATYVTGGAFSLDGIHLTPRGYALAANEIIRTINAYYHSSIPSVDVVKYSGLQFP
jgi:lysophospholipase L1-like esterase